MHAVVDFDVVNNKAGTAIVTIRDYEDELLAGPIEINHGQTVHVQIYSQNPQIGSAIIKFEWDDQDQIIDVGPGEDTITINENDTIAVEAGPYQEEPEGEEEEELLPALPLHNPPPGPQAAPAA